MCRLVALVPKTEFSPAHTYIAAVEMALSERAGNDHGMGSVLLDGSSFKYYKIGEKASKVVFEPKWITWANEGPVVAFAGHTRLASKEWRSNNGVHETGHAHPFLVKERSFLMHNGMFMDHLQIKTDLNLSLDLTDTQSFVELVEHVMGDTKLLTPSHIHEALRRAGEAEYCLLFGTADGDLYAVRGNRTLYWAESNYGTIVNTMDTNIRDLAEAVNPALLAFGHEPMEVDYPKPLTQWRIYNLTGGKVEEVDSLEDIKDINEPPTKATVVTTRHFNTGYTTGGVGGLDVSIAENKGMWAGKILLDHDILGEDELAMMLRELTGQPLKLWTQFSHETLKDLQEILVYAAEKRPELADDEKKQAAWTDYLIACGQKTTEEAYTLAASLVDGFVCPYFLNTIEEIECLLVKTK